MTVLKDKICFLSCLITFMSMIAAEQHLGYFSIHLNAEFGIEDSKMGYFFSIQGFLYLLGCMVIPELFKKTPPKLQMTTFLLLTAFGIGMMGPSRLLHMPNQVWIIALGLGVQAFGTAPAFSYAIPVMQNRCQVRY